MMHKIGSKTFFFTFQPFKTVSRMTFQAQKGSFQVPKLTLSQY